MCPLSLVENSESKVLGLELFIIALNLGMYFGVPAVIIISIKKGN
jgi:hypothetical protein